MNQPHKNVFLVSCVSAKHSKPMPARELYRSKWFLKAGAYVEAQISRWFILSAKYGLPNPDEIVPPYDQTLNDLPRDARRD